MINYISIGLFIIVLVAGVLIKRHTRSKLRDIEGFSPVQIDDDLNIGGRF